MHSVARENRTTFMSACCDKINRHSLEHFFQTLKPFHSCFVAAVSDRRKLSAADYATVRDRRYRRERNKSRARNA